MPWGEVRTGDVGWVLEAFGRGFGIMNRPLTTVHSGGSRSQYLLRPADLLTNETAS